MKYFYLKQKVFSFADKYKVYDDKQQIAYYCQGKMFSLTHKMNFLSGKTDQVIYRFQKKLFTFMPEYHIYDDKDVLVATVKKQFTLLSKKLHVTGNQIDYQVEGNFYAHSFGVLEGQTELASIRKKYFSWGDSYEISISDEVKEAFMLALVILIDSIFHNESKRRHH